MLATNDDTIWQQFEEDELQDPSSRKAVGEGRFVYKTRQLPLTTNLGSPYFGDLSTAVLLDDGRMHREETHDIVNFRAPEILIGHPWTYSADIWMAACVVCAA
jgi:serine/threonine-protein kinase SRPK3